MKNAPSFLRLNKRDTIEDELVIGGIGFRFITRQEFVKPRMWSKASVSVRRLRKSNSQVVLYLFESLKFKVQSSEYIVEIEKVKKSISAETTSGGNQ
jgi:tRNA modification GTPase